MTASLDHMIVFARDRQASAAFLAGMLGAPPPTTAGHFTQVQLDANLTVDFMDTSGDVAMQHYAFLVDDAQFDAAFAQIRSREQTTGPIRIDAGRTKSTRSAERAASSTSKIRAATSWKSARSRRERSGACRRLRDST